MSVSEKEPHAQFVQEEEAQDKYNYHSVGRGVGKVKTVGLDHENLGHVFSEVSSKLKLTIIDVHVVRNIREDLGVGKHEDTEDAVEGDSPLNNVDNLHDHLSGVGRRVLVVLEDKVLVSPVHDEADEDCE